ncbi:MAG: hypothetical protein CSA62_05255 [Planctomycetota bacterium]|nr:MAG: hypothetical protein CSA62_05255 [Planctomycetota bacterium]
MNEVLIAFPSIALALLVCLLLAKLSLGAGVPRVSIYLLVGVALGSFDFSESSVLLGQLFLGQSAKHLFELVTPVAVGFILFRVGGEFQFRALRRFGPKVLALSAMEILVTGVLVGLAVWAATGEWALGVIAPALAISSAPSATLLTLREVEAEGPASRSIILLVGLNNLAALLFFPVLMGLAFGTGHPYEKTAVSFLALFGGMAIGLVAALVLESFTSAKEHAVLGVLTVLGCLGYSHAICNDPMMSAMLSCFGAGFVVINGSARGAALFESNDAMVYPLYVLFFLGSGAELHLETLVALGVLGILFIATRVIGKFAGCWLGARLAGWQDEVPPYLGAGLLCQAGVALGLLHTLEGNDITGPATADLRHVVLGSVVFFELLGPYLCRKCVVAAGEVTLANLMPNFGAPRSRGAMREVRSELGQNLGLRNYAALAQRGQLDVRSCMRRVPDKAALNLTFDRVLKILSESGADIVPVIDDVEHLVGILSFNDVKDLLYDPHVRELIIAQDLMSPISDPLDPDTPLAEALDKLDRKSVQSWPVADAGKLIGILRRTDAYSAVRKAFSTKAQGKQQGSSS